MKKWTSTALGGAPVTDDDLLAVFNSEIWGAIEAIFYQFNSDTQGVIVSGCVLTDNAGNFDMTAGIVYLNGEFMRIPAFTNQAFTKYIAPDTIVNDSRTFQDSTTNTVAVTKQATLVGSAPGSGQYVTIASLIGPDVRRYFGVWKNIPLQNSWVASGSSTPQYKVSVGKVQFRGQVDGTGASSGNITNTGVLPSAGYNVAMPSNRLHVTTLATDAIPVSVTTSGQMNSQDHANTSALYLEGLQYFIN